MGHAIFAIPIARNYAGTYLGCQPGSLLMDSSLWLDRLYDDESLTDNLDDSEAERLLRWGESKLAASLSDHDAEAIIDTIRELNRRVGKGEAFEPLISLLEVESPLDAPNPERDPNES